MGDFLLFGAGALVLVTLVQMFRMYGSTSKTFPTAFARVFGLIVIATLASSLALSDIDLEAKTGAYTLLGTIGGYLAAGAVSRQQGQGRRQGGGSDEDSGAI